MYMTKPDKKIKLLCILHRSPPVHGASKVGDFISSSDVIRCTFDCRFITIRSSKTLSDIGGVSLSKIYLALSLYVQVLFALLFFRPDRIYFTASIKGVAFYRDLPLSVLWKTYGLFKYAPVYYHYHTKGVRDFVSCSKFNLGATKFFLRDVNLILLGQDLSADFDSVDVFKTVSFLPNGVASAPAESVLKSTLLSKYENNEVVRVLYLSNMIKSKGYLEVLNLAKINKGLDVRFDFAGDWQAEADEVEFFQCLEREGLESSVHFHGFVSGTEKKKLLESAHLFVFPTVYPFEAFPLAILESLSYGVPVISTTEGAISSMLDEGCGVIIDDVRDLPSAFTFARNKLVHIDAARCCIRRFSENYTLNEMENNFVSVMSR